MILKIISCSVFIRRNIEKVQPFLVVPFGFDFSAASDLLK